ncbi:MAG: hypothetical protein JSW28_06175, partial [Thermoplasmata archaeon]
YARYGRTMQDSLINIFYNGITTEMRLTFVNTDFSRSLIYLPVPMMEEEETERILRSVNRVVHESIIRHSTSDVVLMESEDAAVQNIARAVKVFALFVILIVGVFLFAVFLNRIHRGDKGKRRKPAQSWPEDVWFEEDFSGEQNPYERYPPVR